MISKFPDIIRTDSFSEMYENRSEDDKVWMKLEHSNMTHVDPDKTVWVDDVTLFK